MKLAIVLVSIAFAVAAPSASAQTWSALGNVTWHGGGCLPSSGTLSYTDGGQGITITFIAETPATGDVLLQVGIFPAFRTSLLTPCGASS